LDYVSALSSLSRARRGSSGRRVLLHRHHYKPTCCAQAHAHNEANSRLARGSSGEGQVRVWRWTMAQMTHLFRPHRGRARAYALPLMDQERRRWSLWKCCATLRVRTSQAMRFRLTNHKSTLARKGSANKEAAAILLRPLPAPRAPRPRRSAKLCQSARNNMQREALVGRESRRAGCESTAPRHSADGGAHLASWSSSFLSSPTAVR